MNVGTFEDEGSSPEPKRLDSLDLQAEAKEVGNFEVSITRVRMGLAFSLVGILAVFILAAFALFIYIARQHDPAMWPAAKELLTIIFGPLVTLVATVLGYYFGSKGG